MDIEKQKKHIIEQVTGMDDAYLLKEIEQLLLREPVIAYSSEGKAMTKKDLIKEILESKEDFKNGDFLSQEDFEKESDLW